MELLYIAYYNPPSKELSKELFRIANESKLKYIICGDFNSKLTSIGCNENNKNGYIIEEILKENDCVVFNDNTHTYYSFRDKNINYSSDLLDLAICSSNLSTSIFV